MERGKKGSPNHSFARPEFRSLRTVTLATQAIAGPSSVTREKKWPCEILVRAVIFFHAVFIRVTEDGLSKRGTTRSQLEANFRKHYLQKISDIFECLLLRHFFFISFQTSFGH